MFYVNNFSPSLRGTISGGTARVFVKIDGNTYEADVNRNAKTWELPAGRIAPALVDDVYDVQVQFFTASFNNKSEVSSQLIIDLTAPDPADIDSVTNVFNESGDAVGAIIIGGSNENGNAIVEILAPDMEKVLGRAEVDEAGNWKAVLKEALETGKDYSAIVIDRAGNASDPTGLTADTTAPEPPVITGLWKHGLKVEAEAGAFVKVTDANGEPLLSADGGALAAMVGNNGKVSFDKSDLENGARFPLDLKVTATDWAGNQSEATQAPAQLSLSYNDTGVSDNDRITKDGTVTVENLIKGGSWFYTINAGEGGASADWQEGSGNSFELPEGRYYWGDIRVYQKDAAGNTSPYQWLSIKTVDTTAPEQLSTDLLEDTGTDQNDRVTTNGQIKVGNLEPGASWFYTTNAGKDWIEGKGDDFILDVGSYQWGDIRLYQVDQAGNRGKQSWVKAVTVEEGKPESSLDKLELSFNDTGSRDDDKVTKDGTVTIKGLGEGNQWFYTINGRDGVDDMVWQQGTGTSFEVPDGQYQWGDIRVYQEDAQGNQSPKEWLHIREVDSSPAERLTVELVEDTGTNQTDRHTSNGTIKVSSLEQGATWFYTVNGGKDWVEGSGSSFTLQDGAYRWGDIRLYQVDQAGNGGYHQWVRGVTVDSKAPNSLTVDLVADTGASDNDFVTRNGTVKIDRADLEGDASFEYSLDGGDSWTQVARGSKFTLEDGTYEWGDVRVRQIDKVGNRSSASWLGKGNDIRVDTDRPEAIGAELVNDTGGSNSDYLTSDGTIRVGTESALEKGATFEYTIDRGKTWVSVESGNRFVLDDGLYDWGDVRVRQVDLAGNKGAQSWIGWPNMRVDPVYKDVDHSAGGTVDGSSTSTTSYNTVSTSHTNVNTSTHSTSNGHWDQKADHWQQKIDHKVDHWQQKVDHKVDHWTQKWNAFHEWKTGLFSWLHPVVLDLDQDQTLDYAEQVMDVTQDGELELTAWASANEGVLVWDKHADGSLQDKDQYAFTEFGGETDLEGLAIGFDTNHDGVLDSTDAAFSEFGVWQDINADGLMDEGEFLTLELLDISAINLESDGIERQPAEGVQEFGRGSAVMADGSEMLLADTAFAYTRLTDDSETGLSVI